MKSFSKLLIVIFFLCSNSRVVLAANTEVGKVVSIEGRVLLRNSEGKEQVTEVKVGQSIFEGSILNTSSEGSTKLLMRDASLLDLGPSTLFKVDEYRFKDGAGKERNAKLSLDYGKIRALVSKKLGNSSSFSVRTKSATMGVRGTEFLVLSEIGDQRRAETQKTDLGRPATGDQIIVVQGKVEVSRQAAGSTPTAASKPVVLTDQMKLTVKGSSDGTGPSREPASQDMKVEKVSLKEIQAQTKDVKILDQTFKQVITIDSSNDSHQGAETLQQMVAGMKDLQMDLARPSDMSCAGCFDPFFGLNHRRPEPSRFAKLRVTFSH